MKGFRFLTFSSFVGLAFAAFFLWAAFFLVGAFAGLALALVPFFATAFFFFGGMIDVRSAEGGGSGGRVRVYPERVFMQNG